jgi:protein-arginine kinase activator protein McsA
MNKCEYCGENEAQFEFKVLRSDNKYETSKGVCGDCVATWFTETPEDLKTMHVEKLEEE